MNLFKKIIAAYKNLTQSAKASFWFVFSSSIQQSMNFLLIPIYTRLLSAEEYGVFSVYTSWSALIVVFAGLNLAGASYNVDMTRYEHDGKRYTSSMTGLWWFHTAIWLLIGALVRNIWTNYTKLGFSVLLAAFCYIFGEGGYDIWLAERRFNPRYQKTVFVTCLFFICNVVIGICAVLLFDGKASAAIWTKAGVMIVFGLWTGVANWKKGGTLCFFPYWRRAFRFNIPLIAYYLSSTILTQCDRVMIHALRGPDQAGIYGIAYSLALTSTILTGSVGNIFAPWEFRHIKAGDFRPVGDVAARFLALAGFVNLSLIALAPEVIALFTTPDYHDAIWAVPPVAYGMFLTCLCSLFTNIEFYYEKKYFITLASVVTAVFNIILNAVTIPVFGYIAAAYTVLISYACLCLIHYFLMETVRRSMKIKARIYPVKRLSIISAATLAFAAAFLSLYEKPAPRYALFVILLILAGSGLASFKSHHPRFSGLL